MKKLEIDEGLRFPQYAQALDFAQLVKDYPPPPEFFRSVYRMPRGNLDRLREKRFLALIQRGWEIPFFKRRWKEAGLAPGAKWLLVEGADGVGHTRSIPLDKAMSDGLLALSA